MVLRMSPPRCAAPAAVAASAVFASCPVAAQWAWKDDNGRTVYSDRPPPASVNTDRSFASRAIRQCCHRRRPAPGTAAGWGPRNRGPPRRRSGPKVLAEQEMEFRKRQQERADAEKKAQDEQSKRAAKGRGL